VPPYNKGSGGSRPAAPAVPAPLDVGDHSCKLVAEVED